MQFLLKSRVGMFFTSKQDKQYTLKILNASFPYKYIYVFLASGLTKNKIDFMKIIE